MSGKWHLGLRPEYHPINRGFKKSSWVKWLTLLNNVEKPELHGDDYIMDFEIAGFGALRRGDWKITFVSAPKGPQRWELFNIWQDPGETRDQKTEMMQDMLGLWEDTKTRLAW